MTLSYVADVPTSAEVPDRLLTSRAVHDDDLGGRRLEREDAVEADPEQLRAVGRADDCGDLATGAVGLLGGRPHRGQPECASQPNAPKPRSELCGDDRTLSAYAEDPIVICLDQHLPGHLPAGADDEDGVPVRLDGERLEWLVDRERDHLGTIA